ncbi:MAG TPA: XdhC family protein [Acidobacteriota bacterium]|nr:XdhC family protein [Acidobacteriota bacterium]
MKELIEILGRYRDIRRQGEAAVLATVVRVEGSAYRGPGARMLWTPQGGATGFLSGGCLEGDVAEHAVEVAQSGEPRLVRYDMTSPDDILWGLGMGCDGIVDVLIESVPPARGPDALDFIDRSIAGRHHAVAALTCQQQGQIALGCKLLLRQDGTLQSDLPQGPHRQRIEAEARQALQSRKSRQVEIEEEGTDLPVFIEHIAPPLHLMIFGAGHDAVPLADAASRLGWSVSVIDHRPAFAKAERFPSADRVECLHPQEADDQIRPGPDCAAVVMTHNFPKDVEWMAWLLPSEVPYIGLLGPRARTDNLLDDLEKQGQQPSQQQLARLYGPVGLDIGADSPQEIALSILAEIRTVLSGRGAGFLRERPGPINDRP